MLCFIDGGVWRRLVTSSVGRRQAENGDWTHGGKGRVMVGRRAIYLGPGWSKHGWYDRMRRKGIILGWYLFLLPRVRGTTNWVICGCGCVVSCQCWVLGAWNAWPDGLANPIRHELSGPNI